jgi:hypothetical protein
MLGRSRYLSNVAWPVPLRQIMQVQRFPLPGHRLNGSWALVIFVAEIVGPMHDCSLPLNRLHFSNVSASMPSVTSTSASKPIAKPSLHCHHIQTTASFFAATSAKPLSSSPLLSRPLAPFLNTSSGSPAIMSSIHCRLLTRPRRGKIP